MTRNESEAGLLLGTSGWSYPEWKNIFYPPNISQDKMLQYYTEFFYTTEINSTFYQIPNINVVRAWNKKTPDNFYFSAKIPNIVTHKAKLDINNNDSAFFALENYLNAMTPLISDKKLLALLLQLPPKFGDDFECDYNRLENFLSIWMNLSDKIKEKINSDDYFPHLVVEFRNSKWLAPKELRNLTLDLLRANNVACCCVSEPLITPNLWLTSEDIFYVRFHGFGNKPWFNYEYSPEELDAWAEKLVPIVNSSEAGSWSGIERYFRGKDEEVIQKRPKSSERKRPKLTKQKLPKKPPQKILIYFNNHFSGYAVKNSMYFSEITRFKTKMPAQSIGQPLELIKKGKKQARLDSFF